MPKRSLEGYVPPPLLKRRKRSHHATEERHPPSPMPLYSRNTNRPMKRNIESIQAGQPVPQKRQKPTYSFETRLCAGFTKDELEAAYARYNELCEQRK